jgi:ABC-2 type transport system permease protein
MRRYLPVVRASFMLGFIYRLHMFFTLLTNAIYIVVIYFLWRSIYRGAESMHGMTFEQTFLYLALASSVFVLFKTFADWGISQDIISGEITRILIRPVDFQVMTFAGALGQMLMQLMLLTVPTLLLLLLVFRVHIPLGINVVFFFVSIGLSFILSFLFDYMVGLTSFYTQSLWGISTTKEILVLVLSGSLIPLPFFPDAVRNVLHVLPFQAIYNVPISMLTDPSLVLSDLINMLGIQLLWVGILLIASRLFFSQAVKVLTINGG